MNQSRWILAVIGSAVVVVGGRAAEWAAYHWGLERVVVVLTLAIVGLVLGLVAVAEIRDRREQARPWAKTWEVQRR